HHRAVGYVQPGMAEDATVGVDHALLCGATHTAPPKRVHGDHTFLVPDRASTKSAPSSCALSARTRGHPRSKALRGLPWTSRAPGARQRHPAARHVPAHAEQGQQARGQLAVAEQRGGKAAYLAVAVAV